MQVDNILKSKRPAVLWVSPVMTIGEVAERLRSTDVGALIVSNDGEALHGLISERDIAQGLAVHGAALLSLKVQDLMTRSVISCSPEDNIAEIARIMTMRRIRHIPVVENGRVRRRHQHRRRAEVADLGDRTRGQCLARPRRRAPVEHFPAKHTLGLDPGEGNLLAAENATAQR